jgi:hypothetical protein
MATRMKVVTKLNQGYWLDGEWVNPKWTANVQEVHNIGFGASPLEATADLQRRLYKFNSVRANIVAHPGQMFLETAN